MQDLVAVEAFVRVVDRGSFSAAAADLGVAKSTVSKRIAALEERLGARLLYRTTRSVRPTEVGATYYERCLAVLAAAEEAERAVTRMQQVPRGRLRVSAPMSFGQRYLAPVVAEFMRDFPEVEVDLDLSDRMVDVIAEGFDVAIRVAALPDSSLIARRLAGSRRLVVGAPSYFRARGRPASPAALAEHDCLLYAYQASGDTWHFDGPGGAQAVRVAGRLRANNGDVLAVAACAGLGLALLPDFIVEPELRAGRLEPTLPEHCRAETALYAVYPHARHLVPKVRAFVDRLAGRFAAAEWPARRRESGDRGGQGY
ncbi:MAG: LysR family transcriptional regulator [Nannocystaceae bacterium]